MNAAAACIASIILRIPPGPDRHIAWAHNTHTHTHTHTHTPIMTKVYKGAKFLYSWPANQAHLKEASIVLTSV